MKFTGENDYESETLFNAIQGLFCKDWDRISKLIMDVHYAGAVLGPIDWHKDRLGKQAYTWLGEFRFWVWETPDWRVYVSNAKGISFEVRKGLEDWDAADAFIDYYKRMGLKT